MCKRKDCLYNDKLYSTTKVRMCYFCYDRGESRKCKAGEGCSRYVQASKEEKDKHRRKRYTYTVDKGYVVGAIAKFL